MSEKINTVIIEDNSDALLYLKSLLQTHFNKISIDSIFIIINS